MIKKLRIKATLVALISLFVLFVSIVTGMVVINRNSLIYHADEVLDEIYQNGSELDDVKETPTDKNGKDLSDVKGDRPEQDDKDDRPERDEKNEPPRNFYDFESYTVVRDETGQVAFVDMRKDGELTKEELSEMTEKALAQKGDRGFVYKYRFLIDRGEEQSKVYFLDCGREISMLIHSSFSEMWISLLAYLVVSCVLVFIIGKITKPFVENYDKQRRFVTDAGHEIRTPLTIINANCDILEMELGESKEPITEIKNQVDHLAELTDDLVYLSRLEEQEKVEKFDFNLSDMVEEKVRSFGALALEKNLELQCDIAPMLTINGNERRIERLIGVLLSNAVKYSTEDSVIKINLHKENKQTVLKVENDTPWKVEKEKLANVFDRFYRSDLSRNSEKGGHGIGLCIAKAIVTDHGGKIKATTKTGNDFCITVTL